MSTAIARNSIKRVRSHDFPEEIHKAKKTFTPPTCIVTNEFGQKSFLIGTCHMVDKESLQNPFFETVLKKSSSLYSESGLYIFNSHPYGTERNEAPQYQHNPFRYHLDVRITEIAAERGMPIIALDEEIPAIYEDLLTMYQDRLELGAEKMEDMYRRDWEKTTLNDPLHSKGVALWKTANLSYLREIRKQDLKAHLRREFHWLKILIPALRKARKPIAIVVGAAHLTGHHSLSERLEGAGFKVEWLTNSSIHRL